MEQKVDVFVEKTGQERCNEQGSIWNGRTCLEDNQKLVFAYSEKKSFGNEPIRKCFDYRRGTPAIQQCSGAQTVSLEYFGKSLRQKDGREYEYGFFYLKLIDSRELCLTVNQFSGLEKEPCDRTSTQNGSQLFTLDPAKPSSKHQSAGRNTFRFVHSGGGLSGENTKMRCLMVRAKSAIVDITDVEGTPITLSDCDTMEPMGETQWIKFIGESD